VPVTSMPEVLGFAGPLAQPANATTPRTTATRAQVRITVGIGSSGPMSQTTTLAGRQVRGNPMYGGRPSMLGRPPVMHQETFNAVSSITKDVCKDESSVPVNFNVTVWPAKLATLNDRCV